MKCTPRLSIALFCLFFSGILCAQVSVPVLSKFQSIEVLQSSLFKGELQLGPGLQITGPATFTDPVKLSNVPTLTGSTEGVLAVDNTGVVKNMPMMLLAEELKKTEVLQNVAAFHVSTLAEFAGQVMFKPGTMITGQAHFINAVAVEGSFTAADAVSFTGLDQTETWNYLLTADESGVIQKATATSIALSLHNTGILSVHDVLTVTNSTTLGGEVVLPEGTEIKGEASFANGVNITGDLGVAGHVAFTGIAENSMATGATHVLVLTANGTIESTPLPNFGPVLDGIGDGGLDEVPCAEDPTTGQMIAQPARWKYSDKVIYTNECTPDLKVGIGYTNPDQRLAVDGDIWASGFVRAGRNVTNGATHQFSGTMDLGRTSEYMRIGHDGVHNVIDTYAPPGGDPNNGDLHLNYNTNNAVIIGDWSKTKTANLSMAGSLKVRDAARIGDHDPTQGRFQVDNGNLILVGNNSFENPGDKAAVFLGDNTHFIRSTYGKGVSLTTYGANDGLFLEQGGKVGIGTGLNSPSARLHIKTSTSTDALLLLENSAGEKFKVASNGVAYARDLNITLTSPFPDYVFQPGYKRMSLPELEKYFWEHRRMPGMPSAEEVAKEGMEVGEVVRVLTEKVEESQLYIIDLHKTIEQMQKRIEELEKARKK